MGKRRVAVYIKLYTDDKEQMKQEVQKAKTFCQNNNFEIVEMIKDFSEDDSIEGLMEYCGIKSNNIYILLTNNLSMIGEDIETIYDRYKYLYDYQYCNLMSIDDGDFKFEIKLKKGGDN